MTRPGPVLRLARLLARVGLPARDRAGLIAELDDVHARRVGSRGRVRADLWYLRQALGFLFRVGLPRLVRGRDGLSGALVRTGLVLRRLGRRPAYAFAFVATLAVGVGGVCTVYATANWVLLRPVPGVTDPSTLVTLRNGSVAASHVSWEVSHPELLLFRERITSLSDLAGHTAVEVNLRLGDGAPRRAAGELVTSNYLEVLGVPLAAGRGFVDEGGQGERADVVVLSHRVATRLAASPGEALGRTVRVNGRAFEVVGVTARGFRGAELPGRAELWFPLPALTIVEPATSPDAPSRRTETIWRRMVGRLAPGATVEQAAAGAEAALATLRAEGGWHSFLATHQRLQTFAGVGLDPGVRTSVARTLGLLSGAAGLLLALAVANLANLALARAASSRGAQAVHIALGASRARILASVADESLALGLAGAAGALALSWGWTLWSGDARLAEAGASLAGLAPDLRVVGVTLAAALGASLLAGLPAALAAGRVRVLDPLRSARHGDRSAHRLRALLVMGQVALSTVLLVGAGLLVRSVANYRAVDMGFVVDGLVTFVVDPHVQGYEPEAVRELAHRLEERLLEDPAVRGAGFVAPYLLASSYVTGAYLPAEASADEDVLIGADYYASPGLLPALGVRVESGRLPGWAAPDAVVVNRPLAAAAFPGVPTAAVPGRALRTPRDPEAHFRIAAVIDPLQLYGGRDEVPVQTFRALEGWSGRGALTGFVRAASSEAAAARAVRAVVAAEAPDLPVFDLRTAGEARDLLFAELGVAARIAATLGLFGVVLAAVGLYGVLAYAVAERTREIGVRAALGATPGGLVGRVLRSGLALAVAGVVLGTGAALVSGRFIRAHLYEVGPRDPWTVGSAVILLLGVAAVASLVPAIRTTRVSPMEVLRVE